MRNFNCIRTIGLTAALCSAAPAASAQPIDESFAEAFARALAESTRDPCVSDGERMERCPERSEEVLPNTALGDYLESIPPDASAAPPSPANVKVTSVSSDSIHRERVDEAVTAGVGGVEQPFQDEARLFVMFRPNLTPQEAQRALADNRLKVIKAAPQIGAVSVDAREALQEFGYVRQNAGASSIENLSKSPINRFARRLRRDGRFAAVTVDAVLTGAQISGVIKPLPPPSRPTVPNITAGGPATAATERDDWGIEASHIDDIWPLLTQPVTVGVLDAGFAAHEDLPMQPGSAIAWRNSDHGNHVAGIMCATHGNGVGIKGVLPNCTVKAAIATVQLPDTATAGPSGVEIEDDIGYLTTLLTEYVIAVLGFIDDNPDAKVLNLSLGYNWMPNFGIDPRAKKMKRIRKEVENQGIIVRGILAFAKRRDVAIFSAAGNDSTDLATPLPSKWASPFNYGSWQIQRLDGWTNGIVVEAYTEDLKRAPFSNVDGHLSCPGNDVLSATAQTRKSYGLMSGTSMASPYCAAAFAALRSLEPNLPLRKSLECFLDPPEKIEGKTPRMDLKDAFEACRTQQ